MIFILKQLEEIEDLLDQKENKNAAAADVITN